MADPLVTDPVNASGAVTLGLAEPERALLAFEAAHPRHSARKDEAIRRRFGRSPAQYYQSLADLIETPAALAYDPVLVSRLRRVRDTRSSRREMRRQQRREQDIRDGQAQWRT